MDYLLFQKSALIGFVLSYIPNPCNILKNVAAESLRKSRDGLTNKAETKGPFEFDPDQKTSTWNLKMPNCLFRWSTINQISINILAVFSHF